MSLERTVTLAGVGNPFEPTVRKKGNELCEITRSGCDGLMVIDPDPDAVAPNESVAVIPNVKAPEAVGVPVNCGLEKVNPPGRFPDVTVKVYGAVPPVGVRICKG